MDTSNLNPGQLYKNYKALCTAIDEPVKTGGSKIIQMDDWKRHFDYRTTTGRHEIQIMSIYDRPKPKELSKHKKVYLDSMSYNLLHYLAENARNEFNTVFLSRGKLAIEFGLCNSNYYDFRGEHEALYNELNEIVATAKEKNGKKFEIDLVNIDQFKQFKEFYQKHGTTIYDRIEGCLNSIKKSSLINIEETYMVEKEVATESGGKKIKEQEATFDEKTLIIATRGKVCTKFGCKNIGGIVVTDRYDAFLNVVNNFWC